MTRHNKYALTIDTSRVCKSDSALRLTMSTAETQLWAIACKGDRTKAELKRAVSEGDMLATVYDFKIPKEALRVGTLDSLMSLSDDLAKMDILAEATVTKLYKQLKDLSDSDEEPTIIGGARRLRPAPPVSTGGALANLSPVGGRALGLCVRRMRHAPDGRPARLRHVGRCAATSPLIDPPTASHWHAPTLPDPSRDDASLPVCVCCGWQCPRTCSRPRAGSGTRRNSS